MKNPSIELYTINKNIYCLKCGHKGVVQSYGHWYPQGLGNHPDALSDMYKGKPHMSHTIGFGGTIPWECTNCGNEGLIDFGGLEGYEQAFETIKKEI